MADDSFNGPTKADWPKEKAKLERDERLHGKKASVLFAVACLQKDPELDGPALTRAWHAIGGEGEIRGRAVGSARSLLGLDVPNRRKPKPAGKRAARGGSGEEYLDLNSVPGLKKLLAAYADAKEIGPKAASIREAIKAADKRELDFLRVVKPDTDEVLGEYIKK